MYKNCCFLCTRACQLLTFKGIFNPLTLKFNMKNTILLIFSIASLSLTAQTYSIIQSTAYHEEKSQTSLEVEIAPDPKEARKAFKKYLKKQHDVKLKRNGNFYAVKQSKVTAITDVQIDLFSAFKENKDGGTQMSLFARKGYDLYITPSSDGTAFSNMRTLFQDFLNQYLGEYYEEKLDDAVGLSGDLKKDQSKITDKNKDLIDDIEENKKDIEKMTKENKEKAEQIEENNKKLKELEKKIRTSDSNVDQLKSKKQGIK